AVFDTRHISRQYASSGLDNKAASEKLEEARPRLYLHELAHFVLHRHLIFKNVKDAGFARSAAAEMEDDAWFWANSVIGLAVGNRAYLAKTNTFLDDC